MDLYYLLGGLLGGVIRGLVGYVKYISSYKGVKFQWLYFSVMVGLSGVIGLVTGWVANGILLSEMNLLYAFLAGYAGGDFMENAFKIVFKKPTIFKIPEAIKESLK